MIEELGGQEGALPVPNNFPQDLENQEFNYVYIDSRLDPEFPLEGRLTSGESLDTNGELSIQEAEPQGEKPVLAPPSELTFPQVEQLEGAGEDGTPEN